MLLPEDAATAAQNAKAVSPVSTARVHRHSREAPDDHAVERMRLRFRGIWQLVGLWLRRRSDRTTLRSLSQRDIHDFCPREGDAEAEMNKPFWRA